MIKKFRVGDVFSDGVNEYLVLDIVVGEREVEGNWNDNTRKVKLKDSYFCVDVKTNINYYSEFLSQEEYYFVRHSSSVIEKIVDKLYSCPRCNGKLENKLSEYCGETIKKCKSCGWC